MFGGSDGFFTCGPGSEPATLGAIGSGSEPATLGAIVVVGCAIAPLVSTSCASAEGYSISDAISSGKN